MATIIDGRKTREIRLPDLISKVKRLSYTPKLAIVQVGDRPDSTSYIRAKKIFAKKIGVEVEHQQYPPTISQAELLVQINLMNSRKDIQGIIIQLPLPTHIDREIVINSILPYKDVDALTSANVARWMGGKGIIPATARGIKELFEQYAISLKGKAITVVGRSDLVGKPIAVMCANEGAKVTVCHSKTVDLVADTKNADILIVATGKPKLIRKEHVNPRQIVIDVGISRIGLEQLVGDVDFTQVSDIVKAISPVPGGVGPMTVLALFENLIDLCPVKL